MNILLVRPKLCTKEKVDAPLGLAILGAIAQKLGHTVQIVDLHLEDLPTDRSYDVVGVTGVNAQKDQIIRVARQFPKATVVVGGCWATYSTEEALREKSIAHVCVGEGESWWKKFLTEFPEAPTERMPVKDLDAVPFPAWDLVRNLSEYGRFSVWSSRGCPFQCCFCSVHNYFSRTWRARSPKSVVSEIEYVAKRFEARRFTFVDDNPTLDPGRFERICEGIIEKNLTLVFDADAGLRVDRLPDSLLFAMKKAGFKRIQINPESGVQRVLSEVIHKNLDISKLFHVAEYSRSIGLDVDACFIIGFPMETMDEVKATIQTAHRLRELGCNAYVGNAVPNPKTELYDDAKADGFLRFDGEELEDKKAFGAKERAVHCLTSPYWEPEEITRLHLAECKADRRSSVKRLAFTRRGVKKLLREPLSLRRYL